jgi:hypothetical protein
MPWTITDVDRFKRGLTPAQKRQWVQVANDALRRCLQRGGNQRRCESSAIRQASGVVGHSESNKDMKTNILTMQFISELELNSNYEVRTEQYEGREHLVVPVIMMVEGVHEGSRGAVLHTANDLGHSPGAYNGIPVVVYHPQDEDGAFISANAPGVLDQSMVGRVFNTRFEDNKLRAEAWLDVQRMAAVSPLALSYITEQHPLEVSLGLFNDEEEVEGEWNNEHYIAIAHNHQPDHLALLPAGVGACSWEDGCGIRTNQKGGNDVKNDLTSKMKEFSKEGFCINEITCNVEQGFRELVQNAQAKLDRMDDDMKIHFLQEIYNDYMVYEIRRRNGDGQGGVELYRRDYEVNNNNEIEFTGDPQRVRREVEYVVQKLIRTKRNNNQRKETQMSDTKKHECDTCEQLIQKLIANEQTNFAEEDREWLVNLSEDQLKKLDPPEVKAPRVNKEKDGPKVTTNTDNNDDPNKKTEKPVQGIEALTDEQKAALAYGEKQLKARRTELVQTIQANAKDVWTNEELEKMDLDLLEKVSESIKPVTDYSAVVGGMYNNTSDELLLPAGVEVREDKK